MNTLDLIAYYAGLLIMQYIGKPKAFAHIEALVTPVIMPQTSIQTIAFSGVAASGTFVLRYNGNNTAAINWNDSVSTIQTKLQAVTGLGSVTVTGSIASELLTITFTGVTPPAFLLTVFSNSLATSASVAISLDVEEIDVTLPLAIQGAYNLVEGTDLAVGTQLDVLGKYIGIARTGFTFTGPITLTDAQYLQVLRIQIVNNSNGSSLAQIQNLLHRFFPGTLLVFDYQNMHMSYLFDSAIGSVELAEFFVVQNLLPKPMGVQLAALIYAASVSSFFGFRTYPVPAGATITGFNSYASYTTNTPWLSYTNAIFPP